MKIKSLLVTAVLATAILCSGGVIKATSITDLQAQITALQAQLQALQGQQGITTWCHDFGTNLGYLNSGTAEVGYLHSALDKELISYAPDGTNIYGYATTSAVAQFQAKYGISQTGYFGSLTRIKLKSLYGCSTTTTTLPQGCTSTSGYSSTTGQSCASGTCTPNWTCTWGSCVNGYQSQVALDLNNCGITSGQIVCPALAQTCNPNTQSSAALTLVSATSSYAYNATNPANSIASGVITFRIRPDGGDLLPITSDNVIVQVCGSNGCTSTGVTKVVTISPIQNIIPEGTESTVTVNVAYAGGSGFIYFKISEIDWTIGNATTHQTSGLDSYKTPSVNAYGGPTTPSITVTSPNGGEQWQKGISRTITWQDNRQTLLPVHYDIKLITAVMPRTIATQVSGSSYSWVVGNINDLQDTSGSVNNGQYSIQVCESGTSICDSSNNYFTITASGNFPQGCTSTSGYSSTTGQPCSATAQPSITVTSPTAGTTYSTGTTMNINWTAPAGTQSNASVSLFFFQNKMVNGSQINLTVTPAVAMSLGTYSWTIPTTVAPGDQFYVRARCDSGCANPSYTTYDSGPFTITASGTPSITVTSPNGGTYKVGDKIHIQWVPPVSNSTSDILYITIQNFGGTTGDGSIPGISAMLGASSYDYTVPTTLLPGSMYKVAISGVVNGIAVSGSTANYFTITAPTATPSITVTSPNGGESWAIGSTHNITWTLSGTLPSTDTVNIQVSNSSNVVIYQIHTLTAAQGSSGVYSWTVPNNFTGDPNGRYKIKIDDQQTGLINDSSDNYFTITAPTATPSITVTSPNGGESWAIGSTHNITWTSSGLSSNAYVYLGINGDGVTSNMTGAQIAYVLASAGSYSWTIPTTLGENLAGKNYKVYVTWYGGSSNYVGDTSNSNFTIIAPTNATCNDSDGGINYYTRGTLTTNAVQWVSPISDSCQTVVSGTANSGVTEDVNSCTGDNCYVREYSCNGTTPIGNTPFKCLNGCSNGACIQATTPSITVTSPNGGEQWVQGSTHNITWSSTGLTNLAIKISNYSAGNAYAIVSSAPALSGTYSWQVGATLSGLTMPAGTQYKIQVYDPDNPAVSSSTANYFTITAPAPTPISVSCSADLQSAQVGQGVTWTATATGGNGTYTYNWSGTDGLTGSSASVAKTYSTAGTKTAAVSVSSGSATPVNYTCNKLDVSAATTCSPNWQCTGWNTSCLSTAQSLRTQIATLNTQLGEPPYDDQVSLIMLQEINSLQSQLSQLSMTRTCIDSNNCGGTFGRPSLTQSCTSSPLGANLDYSQYSIASISDAITRMLAEIQVMFKK